MICPNCGSPVNDGDVFCSNCGARTQPTPPQETPAQYPPQQQPPVTPPFPSVAPPVATGSKTGLIIAAVIGIVVILAGAIVAGVLLFSGDGDDNPPPNIADEAPVSTPPTSTPPAGDGEDIETPELIGYLTPEEAVQAETPDGWVIEWMGDGDGWSEYWVGPPASEFTDVYIVEPQSDGSWLVTDIQPLADQTDSAYGADAAIAVVDEWLSAVYEDRGNDAWALTISPFSEDAASSSISSGMLLGWTTDGVDSAEDDTHWVKVTESWEWGDEQWQYYVVPTEMGYYISDIAMW